MRLRSMLLPLLLLLVTATGRAAPDEPIVLGTGQLLTIDGKPVSVGHTASVEVVDWNNDGKKDLLIGTFSGGNVLLFLNEGSDTAPRFGEGTKLSANGAAITAGFG